jgi:ferredoxin-type protein NapH
MLQIARKTAALAAFAAFQFPAVHLLFSPVLAVAGAAQGVLSASLALYLTLGLLALVFGRAFCGWLCPGTAVQECCVSLGAKRTSGRRYSTKYIVFALWASAVAIAAIHAGGFHRVDLSFGIDASGGAVRAFILSFGAFFILLPLSLLAGRFTMCHHACWVGPFLIAGARLRELGGWPALRLRAEPDRCAGCDECVDSCLMSLPVRDMVAAGKMANDECILCGHCVSTCPTGAIHLGFTARPV